LAMLAVQFPLAKMHKDFPMAI
jgi:hypothetical protein